MNEANETMELTAGQMLRLARTNGRRKRELNTVARTLCIREEFLDALENDDFARIPELVYILGFARNYAMELELDPYVIVDKIKQQLGLVEEEDAVEVEEGGEVAAPGANAAAEPVPMGLGGGFVRQNAKGLLAVVLLIVAIAAGASILTRSFGPAAPAPELAEVANTKYNMPVHREYGLKNRDYALVVLQATGTTWIQIKNSAGSVIFEHSMVAGDVYYALSGSTATIGNAGAIDIWVNGKEIPKIGGEHQRILDLTLSPETLAK